MYVCMYVCMYACMYVCMHHNVCMCVCRYVWLCVPVCVCACSVCMYVLVDGWMDGRMALPCLPVWMAGCLYACMYVCACMYSRVVDKRSHQEDTSPSHVCMHTYILTDNTHIHIYTYMQARMHTYTHTHVHPHIHTCSQAHIQAGIHMYTVRLHQEVINPPLGAP